MPECMSCLLCDSGYRLWRCRDYVLHGLFAAFFILLALCLGGTFVVAQLTGLNSTPSLVGFGILLGATLLSFVGIVIVVILQSL